MLEIQGINAFYGQAQVLQDISFQVGAGEVVALLGRNGAGKSTTMKTLMGMVNSTAGDIRFQGTPIKALPTHRICQMGLGYVPEDRRIFSDLTVLENLEVGKQKPRDGAPVWEAEKLFELFPNLKERKNNAGGQMSGGEQQMLSIARTLMGNPRAILLDEPSEGIAPVIVEQMAKTIQALKKEGLAVLLSEQNLHFAKLVSDRAVIIEKGEVRYQGTIRELEEKPEIRDAYLAV
ncbi:ABC transporter ATP-binding protein [Sneathiella chinensis]|uniref:ABC transporter ATP-binding protein n=1 Tax=Sneathiella chinensis TaxID=349750 RepID=A0ABQ5U2A0_9PROT|nr:ABC transporter ATP-binding protein [Sneathiella chinensis]GLQ05541.1 ABC transporter ATP-binding protein [Sneathiella chinensis]